MASYKKAFTLFEMLIVLTILSIILLALQVVPPQRLALSYQMKIFKDQLKTQIYLTQECSMLHQTPYYVRFMPGSTIYIVNGHTGQIDDQVECPEDWSIINQVTFTYLPSGRTDHFETVYFHHRDGDEMALVFQLGSGQFVFKS